MQFRVSPLYKHGKRNARSKLGSTVEGDLNLSTGRHAVTGRVVSEACILSSDGGALLPSLHDAQCICIAGHGMQLRGFEFDGAREVVQEWWCVPVTAKEPAGATA